MLPSTGPGAPVGASAHGDLTGAACATEQTADGRTLFVNVQHPGESTPAYGAGPFTFQSQWPGNQGYGPAGRPRSATIVITRTDGGVIGL